LDTRAEAGPADPCPGTRAGGERLRPYHPLPLPSRSPPSPINPTPLPPSSHQLISGTAEVFGVELAEGRSYHLAPGRKLAVFTWYGAEVAVGGAVSTVYTSDETAVPLHANLHQRLEGRREEARATGASGPRVLLAGPTDSGKSTICRTLCAYACRVGRAPTYVDLDLGQGEVSVPGAVAATPLDRLCLNVEDGYAHTTPLAYFFGHPSAHETAAVYRNYVQRLADTVNRRMASDDLARVSGLVVNTMGWVEGEGYPVLLEAIRAFQADIVVVMGHDRLFAQLSEDVKKIEYPVTAGAAQDGGKGAGAGVGAGASSSSSSSSSSSLAGGRPPKAVSVLKLARSGGVVQRDTPFRRAARKSRFKEYFYGPDRGPGVPPSLSPEVITVKFDDVFVARVGGATVDAGLVPVGKQSALDPLRVTRVLPTAGLLNHVLGVSFAATDKQIPHVNVAGYVHVRGVNAEARTLTLLVPCAGQLPSKFLVMGSSVWVEA
jgi:polyribonucleotide 5'-hydroxyl-kinase